VEDCGLDIEAMTSDSHTPLYFAASYGENLEVCKYLLEKGAKVNSGDTPPLLNAAQVL
jgi:ankyrin repeat protein